MELRIWNVELVGFADYIIMNYSIKIIIQYSLFTIHYGQRPSGCISYENAAKLLKLRYAYKIFKLSTQDFASDPFFLF